MSNTVSKRSNSLPSWMVSAWVISLATLLSSCGGGSGGGELPEPTPEAAAPTPAPAPAAETPAPAAAPASPAPVSAPALAATPQSTPSPEPEISLQLSAGQTWVPRLSSTTITWSATEADSCEASDGWSGQQATAGTASTGPLMRDQTFSLSCSNGAHSSIAVITVRVRQARINWAPPTTNVDGSALTNLAGHRIHWGTSSGTYSSSVDVNNPQQNSYVIELTPGLYYFNVTSLNEDGIQSPYSLERSKEVK